ncbi:hypothetical protein P350_11350 [Burkholderia cepacia JBK9]|nr:hypothetical protein P350_11350 [Burkholderia cepacia JBK9]
MNEINHGGSAFPLADAQWVHRIGAAAIEGITDSAERDRAYTEATARACAGMTLRDYFAAKAMPMAFDYVRRIDADGTPDGESESEHRLKTYDFDWPTPDEGITGDELYVARLCYQMADAMLRARGEA